MKTETEEKITQAETQAEQHFAHARELSALADTMQQYGCNTVRELMDRLGCPSVDQLHDYIARASRHDEVMP